MTNKYIFLIGILCIINLILLSNFNVNNSHGVVVNIKNKIDFEIVYLNQECSNDLEEFYRDDSYIYVSPCIKISNILIRFSNGDEFKLKSIIDKKIISLQELINKGLKVEKIELNNNSTSNVNDSKENNNSNNNIVKENIDEKVILTLQKIQEYNKKIKERTNTLYDIDNIKSLTKEEIKKYITSYDLPKLPKYDGDIEYNTSNIDNILNNRNLDNIDSNITKGIVVKRTNLRSFPTNISFYDKKNVKDFDRLQETELLVNTSVLIIHQSLDNLWYFVISSTYFGWVLQSDVAYVSDSDYNYFIKNNSFGIITKTSFNINDTILDMSVKLPLVKVNQDSLVLMMPIKSNIGYVEKKEITINNDDVSLGYLPYTKENVYKLANAYINTPYSWGGKDVGVDCSSFISNLYRTFGFIFPRNTSSQNSSVGSVINLGSISDIEKLNIIDGTNPSLLYMNGHVMLYIGVENNKHYIIHASGSDGKVVKSILDNSTYLKKINKLIEIK